MSLLTKLEMDQAEMAQEGRRGAGPGEDGSRRGFGLRGLLRECVDYSIPIKNVGERGTVFLPPPKCDIYKPKKEERKVFIIPSSYPDYSRRFKGSPHIFSFSHFTKMCILLFF